MAMTLRTLQREVLRIWGIESDLLPEPYAYLNASATGCINAAMQDIWTYGEDYFAKVTKSVTLVAGVSSYVLDNDIQNVVDPAWFSVDNKTINRIQNRGEYLNYAKTYLGQTGNIVANSRPVSYFVEQIRQTGSDPAKVTLKLVPAPATSETLNIDVLTEAPSYTQSDVCADIELPIPAKYVESVLAPIARWRACYNFQSILSPAQQAALPSITEQKDAAFVILSKLRPRGEQDHVNASKTPTGFNPNKR